MRTLYLSLLLILVVLYLSGCSGTRKLNPDNPYTQASVKVITKDAQVREGIVIKKSGDVLYFVDSESHKKDSLNYNQIRKMETSQNIYDFEGFPIPVTDIKKAKGMKKMLYYSGGGLILGTFTGAGVGIGLIAAGADIPAIISMAVFGIGGAWMFGSMGSDKDFEEATYQVRKERYELRKVKMEKMLKEERKKLEDQKRQKEELIQKKKD